jgi:hypothetical protein
MLTKEGSTTALKSSSAPADINSGIILRSPGGAKPAAGEKPVPGTSRSRPESQQLQQRRLRPAASSTSEGSATKIIPNQWNTIGDRQRRSLHGRLQRGKVVDAHDARRASGAIGLQLAHPEDVRRTSVPNLKIRRLKAHTN